MECLPLFFAGFLVGLSLGMLLANRWWTKADVYKRDARDRHQGPPGAPPPDYWGKGTKGGTNRVNTGYNHQYHE